ncbi:hypothetical protein [Nostoc sp. C110]|uniref:hypothetical protein n=1 Tax=Nostoc sp. C110 TaxID=3349876 RepID=UPI00370DE27C
MKNTCNASVESKGFCFYKATNGIKRHLAIDTLGFPFFTHCTRANVSDDAGLKEKFTLNIDYLKSKPIDIPKITILLDHGYHPEYLTQELERIYPEDHDQNPVSTFYETLKTRESSTRKMWICSGSSQMGNQALQCLDGAL